MKFKQYTFFSIGLAGFMLAGCGEGEFSESGFQQDDGDYTAVVPAPADLQSGMPAERPKEVLSVADLTPPEAWLLLLYQKRADHDPERDAFYYRALLEKVLAHVHEDKRVVTNRLVQVTRQLADKGIEADQKSLLTDFAAFLSEVNETYRVQQFFLKEHQEDTFQIDLAVAVLPSLCAEHQH